MTSIKRRLQRERRSVRKRTKNSDRKRVHFAFWRCQLFLTSSCFSLSRNQPTKYFDRILFRVLQPKSDENTMTWRTHVTDSSVSRWCNVTSTVNPTWHSRRTLMQNWDKRNVWSKARARDQARKKLKNHWSSSQVHSPDFKNVNSFRSTARGSDIHAAHNWTEVGSHKKLFNAEGKEITVHFTKN
jgi:hypothetical protein